MQNDLIPALERVLLCYKDDEPMDAADAARIRAHIADLRAGNLVRRADVLPSSRATVEGMAKRMGGRFVWNDAIAAGAHEGGGDA